MADPLQGIVRQLPDRSSPPVLSADERLIRYDVHRRRVLERDPWIRRGSVRLYVVTTSRFVEFRPERVVIRGLGNPPSSLELNILCHLECAPEASRAEQLVAAIVVDDSPAASLTRIVHDSLKRCETQLRVASRDPVLSFSSVKEEWQRTVAEEIGKRTGLTALVKLDVDADLSELTVTSSIECHVSDCDEKVRVDLEAHLAVADESRATAAKGRDAEIKTAIESAVRKWCAEQCKIGWVLGDKRQLVRAGLRDVLERVPELDSLGRRLARASTKVEPLFAFEHEPKVEETGLVASLRDSEERVQVDLRLTLIADDHARVLQSGGVGDEFRAGLRRRVSQWFIEHCDIPSAVAPGAFPKRDMLRKDLASYAMDHGYELRELEPTVRPRFSTQSRLEIGPQQMSVNLNDQRTTAKVEFALRIAWSDPSLAVNSRVTSEQLVRGIRDRLADFCARELSVADACGEIAVLHGRFSSEIERVLRADGWCIEGFELKVAPNFALPSGDIVVHSVTCDLGRSGERVVVEHRLRPQVDNWDVYRSSGIGELVPYLTRLLDEITRNILFELPYLDVLRGFHADAESIAAAKGTGGRRGWIESKVEQQMLAILEPKGCSIRQFSSVPEDAIFKLMRGFDIDVERREYETKLTEVSVPIALHLSGRLVHPERLQAEQLLRQDVKIESVIAEIAERAAAHVVHDTEPAVFYGKFSRPMPFDAGEEGDPALGPRANARRIGIEGQDRSAPPSSAPLSVEERIQEQVRVRLSRIGVLCSVVVKRAETEFSRWLSDLLHKSRDVDVEVTSIDLDPNIRFQLSYRINGFDPSLLGILETKRKATPEECLKEIDRFVERTIRAPLQMMPGEFVELAASTAIEGVGEGKAHARMRANPVVQMVVDKVHEAFGVWMDVHAVCVLGSAVKSTLGTAASEGRARRALIDRKEREKLDVLLDKQQEVIKSGEFDPDDAMSKQLQQRIEELRGEQDDSESVRKLRRRVEERTERARGVLDPSRQLGNEPPQDRDQDVGHEAGAEGDS